MRTSARSSRPRDSTRPPTAIPAGLYEGTVWHRRFVPVDNDFSYRVAMVHLDVDHVDDALSVSPLASQGRLRPLRFDRRDHMGDPGVGLGDAVRDLVGDRSGRRPEGPVSMVAHLRTWGWCFNPITVFWCHSPEDPERIEAQVLSVTNTPWKQRHAYVVEPDPDAGPGPWEASFAKELHVSPFLPMDLDYQLRSTAPVENLSVSLDVTRDGEKVFEASYVAQRRPLDGRGVRRLLVRYPLMTHRVSAGIHRQAVRLWRRRVPVVAHPEGVPPRWRSEEGT